MSLCWIFSPVLALTGLKNVLISTVIFKSSSYRPRSNPSMQARVKKIQHRDIQVKFTFGILKKKKRKCLDGLVDGFRNPTGKSHGFLGHRSQRLQWPIVITRCPASVRRPSVVRPSVVRRPLNYLHFRLLLQNRVMDFDETWYGWSTQGPLQVLLFFGQIRPGGGSRAGQK